MPFELPQLDYNHNALEPHIDQKTMEIHHGKHHAGYTAKLTPLLMELIFKKSIDELMTSLDMSVLSRRWILQSLLWKIMSLAVENWTLADAIIEILDHLILKMLSKAVATQFGPDGHG